MTWSCGVCEHRWPEAVPTCLECLTRERDAADSRLEQLTEALRATLHAYDRADEHIRKRLQPEFEHLGEHRFATWWHGIYDEVDRARAVLVGDSTPGETETGGD